MKTRIIIKVLATLVILSLSGTAASVQDVSKVPAELQKLARETLQAGKPYFIWCIEKQLERGTIPGGQRVALADVLYIANDATNAPSFCIRCETDFNEEVKKTDPKRTNYMTSARLDKGMEPGATNGKMTVGVQLRDALDEAGIVKIYVVEASEQHMENKGNARSNILELKIEKSKEAK